MRKNTWLSYFLYDILILSYIVSTNKALMYLDKQAQITYNVLPLMLWSIVIFIVLGILLGLEKFLLEIKKDGKWRINLPKVIFLGVPSLYFSLGILLYYCPIDFIRQILSYPISFFIEARINFIPIFQMLLGYIIITSFIKVEEQFKI